MNSEFIFELDIYMIIRFIIALSSAALGIFCLVLRNNRLKNGNVVCSKGTFWIPCVFLLGNPIFMIAALFYNPYTYIEIPVALIFSIWIIFFWINDCITFYDDGFVRTNVIFMKKFYPYSAVVGLRIVKRKISTNSSTSYVEFADITVIQENKVKCKKLSVEVESYNFREFMRMIDTKRPKLRNVQEIHLDNSTYAKIYDKP